MRTRFFVLWVAAGVMELPFLEIFCRGEEGWLNRHPIEGVLFHTAAALLLFFSVAKGKGWSHRKMLWPTTLGFLTFILPLFGWVISLVLYLELLRNRDWNVSLEDERMEQEEARLRMAAGSRWERIYRELDFMPLADILAGDDPDLKRGAIERLAIHRSPEAIALLLSHRGDPIPDVRFHITSALARIKKEFDEQLEAAKETMKKDVYKVSARTFLARTYLLYSQSNLLDEVTAEAYTREAIYHLENSIQTPYASVEAYRTLVDLHVARQEWGKAFEVLRALGERHGVDSPDLMKSRAGIYFRMGQFDRLVEEIKGIKSRGLATGEWGVIADWWGVG